MAHESTETIVSGMTAICGFVPERVSDGRAECVV